MLSEINQTLKDEYHVFAHRQNTELISIYLSIYLDVSISTYIFTYICII
jgi:hypothetical protein